MKYFQKLVGEKVYLSPRSVDDAETYLKWMSDFQVTDYTGRTAQVLTIDGEIEYLKGKNLDTNEYHFGIVTLGNDKLIGSLSLERINHISKSAELGILIGDEEYRGSGYGADAIKLLLDYAFNYLNMHSVWLHLIDCNDRAHACYTKCGFKDCGRRPEAIYLNGKYHDQLTMCILDREFNGEQYIKNRLIK